MSLKRFKRDAFQLIREQSKSDVLVSLCLYLSLSYSWLSALTGPLVCLIYANVFSPQVYLCFFLSKFISYLNHKLSGALVNLKDFECCGLCTPAELQQFGEIGKGIHSVCEDLAENTASPAYSMSRPEVCTDHASDGWGSESNHEYLNKNVQALGRQLGEAAGRLKEKELKVAELEATIKTMESPLEDVERTIQLQQKRSEEMEAELESLFKQKVEAEVEFIAMTRSNKELSSLVETHIKLLREQKSLVRELARSSQTAAEVENKAAVLQDKLKEVDNLYKESTGSEEIVRMQKRVFKFTKCLFMQLILLLLAFGLFFSQLSPKSAVVVPT